MTESWQTMHAKAVAKAASQQPQCGACGGYLAEDAQYAPATCPKCGVTLPESPPGSKPPKSAGRGKPKASNPWRRDRVFIEMFAETMAKHVRLAIDATVAPLKAEIAALKAKKRAKPKASP